MLLICWNRTKRIEHSKKSTFICKRQVLIETWRNDGCHLIYADKFELKNHLWIELFVFIYVVAAAAAVVSTSCCIFKLRHQLLLHEWVRTSYCFDIQLVGQRILNRLKDTRLIDCSHFSYKDSSTYSFYILSKVKMRDEEEENAKYG